MSDFTSNFWSVFVTTLTLVGIIACGILLWMAGRKKVAATSDNTTGHVWDEDLVEMNNPLPRWWVWLFVITIVFGLGYLALPPLFILRVQFAQNEHQLVQDAHGVGTRPTSGVEDVAGVDGGNECVNFCLRKSVLFLGRQTAFPARLWHLPWWWRAKLLPGHLQGRP